MCKVDKTLQCCLLCHIRKILEISEVGPTFLLLVVTNLMKHSETKKMYSTGIYGKENQLAFKNCIFLLGHFRKVFGDKWIYYKNLK